ncbi:MAG: hypothetical protein JST22_13340 [Bacteroidetes bacterium]|nr:hypothetical protein [Bacteroidota bacterium]
MSEKEPLIWILLSRYAVERTFSNWRNLGRPNVTVKYSYDHRKFLDTLLAKKGSTTLFFEFLTYDPTGQIATQEWKHGSAPKTRQRYTYDSVQRLARWTYGVASTVPATDSVNYSYDAVGNRQRTKLGASVYDTLLYTSGTSQLQNHTTSPSIGAHVRTDYHYNGNGSMTWRSRTDVTSIWSALGSEEYGYSYRDLLKRYINENAGGSMQYDWRYRYNAMGEREQKRLYNQSSSDSTKMYPWVYYLLGGNKAQLAVYHGQQTRSAICSDTGRRVYMYPSEYLTYGTGGTANLTTMPTGKRQYVLTDHLGSVRETLDTAGTVLATRDYEPFGADLAVTGVNPREKYIGKEFDAENALGNFGVRPYDPTIGRFVGVDKLWEKYRGISGYQYAGDNPSMVRDGSGLQLDFSRFQKHDVDGIAEQWLITDLQNKTGLTLNIDEANHRLLFQKDASGNPLVTAGIGSALARQWIIDAIESGVVVPVDLDYHSKGECQFNGDDQTVYLSPKQINTFIAGAHNVDPTTMGWGISFIHETLHSSVEPTMGGLNDDLSKFGAIGGVENFVNRMRAELGPQYGQRLSYIPLVDPNNRAAYVPFNQSALMQLLHSPPLMPPTGSSGAYVSIPK